MGLEFWDAQRQKYVLYASAEKHSADCARYPLEHIPRRVFLDTNVVNRLVTWDSHIFEHEPLPDALEPTLALDIEALTVTACSR
jgi:hypothetical protein